MTGFLGADSAELRGLAAHFDSRAAALHHLETQTTWQVHSAPWQGADVSRFIHDWNTKHRRALVAAASMLTMGAQELRTQADQQDEASSAGTEAASGAVSAAWMRAYVKSHPMRLSSDPAKAAAQWAKLSPDERQAYIKVSPEIVGATDGLPAEDRSAANKILLSKTKEEFDQRLVTDDDKLQSYLRHLRTGWSRLPMPGDVFNVEVGGFISLQESVRLDQLHHAVAYDEKVLGNAQAVSNKLSEAKELGTDSFLLIYQPEAFGADGRAAIAFGNPDHAANTAIIVPGLNATVQSVYSENSDANNLYRQMTLTNPDQKASVIAYMGYDAPELNLSVVTEDRALEGAELLRSDVAGWRTAHDPSSSHVTVIGHSYGSTTVSDSVVAGLVADDFVLIGSPGMGQADGDDFPSGHFYSGSASRDPVADLSRFGEDPASYGSGAIRFHAESTHRGDEPLNLFEDHSRYFEARQEQGVFQPSESLSSLGKIANGQGLSAADVAAPKLDNTLGSVDSERWHRPSWGADESPQ